jgi:hypothetical protein
VVLFVHAVELMGGEETVAQLVWYIAQTKDTGSAKKLVEAYHVYGKSGWVSDYGPIYPAEPHNQMRYWVREWAGLEILDEDGPYWIPFGGNWTSTPVSIAASLRPPKWRKAGLGAPSGIDPELWRNRSYVLDEVKQWRDGFLKAKGKI